MLVGEGLQLSVDVICVHGGTLGWLDIDESSIGACFTVQEADPSLMSSNSLATSSSLVKRMTC